MTVTYFKRFRMHIDLSLEFDWTVDERVSQYEFLPWDTSLIKAHADAKFASFCDELDSHVFPCLGNFDGCLKLMNEISCRQGFIPAATWLVIYRSASNAVAENCGTVQGIRSQTNVGAIQNLGIVPQHRGCGLGSALLLESLKGFRSVGVNEVNLEVTAHNDGALRLYQRLGFEITKTVYKSADLNY